MHYMLMNKDVAIASFDICNNDIKEVRVYAALPIGCSGDMLPKWLYDRTAGCSNKCLRQWLRKHGHCTIHNLLQLTHSVSLNDCYWVRENSSSMTWQDVSPYTHSYSELLSQASLGFNTNGIIHNRLCPDLSTDGTYPKFWRNTKRGVELCKGGGQIYGSKGREPYCEVLASQIYSQLHAGIPYRLDKAYGKVVSVCELFTSEDSTFMPYNKMYSDAFSLTAVLYIYRGIPGDNAVHRMFIADAITCNTDRHTCNFGFLCDGALKPTVLSAAPGYDYNQALLAQCDFEDIDSTFEYAAMLKSYYGLDFIDIAKQCMTSDIRDDMIKLKGVELTLPEYDDCFHEEYAKWLTCLVNERITEILDATK